MLHSMLFFYILFFIQVVTESVPVSSSAHVQLAQTIMHEFFAYTWENIVDFEVFLHFMHIPTLCIIVFFFRKRFLLVLVPFVLSLSKQVRVLSFDRLRTNGPYRCWIIVGKILCLTMIADIITALFFLFFKICPISLPLGIGLTITAIALYSLRLSIATRVVWNWRVAVLLGTVQGIALLPGISRFAAVYAVACWLGLTKRKAFEITWLVQFPLILAAAIRSTYILWSFDQLASLFHFLPLFITLLMTLCGFGMFYLAAYLAYNNKLWWFSFYMIVPISVWLYLCIM